LNPVRADYYHCLIVLDDDAPFFETMQNNYIVLDETDHYVMLKDYKTREKHGVLKLPLPEELYRLVMRHLTDNDRPHLFVNENGDFFTRQTFSTWANRKLTKAFGRPMTLTAIRHSFCSQLDFNKPIKELNEVAHSMGHSVGTQRLYKWEGTSNEVVMPEKKE
jgi:integrase